MKKKKKLSEKKIFPNLFLPCKADSCKVNELYQLNNQKTQKELSTIIWNIYVKMCMFLGIKMVWLCDSLILREVTEKTIQRNSTAYRE